MNIFSHDLFQQLHGYNNVPSITIDVIVLIGIQPRCGCNIRSLSTTDETVVIGIEPLRGCNKC